MKDQLIFDVTSAETIADSDSVGAYVRASDGTLITHTDVSGKKGLDVNVLSGVNVEIDLSHVDDSVALGDGSNLITSTTIGSDIALDVNLINKIPNTAILSSAETLAAVGTAQKVVSSNLANREYLFIYNKSNRKVYIGGADVDGSNGFPLSPSAYLKLRAGVAIDVYYDGEAIGQEIRTLEIS